MPYISLCITFKFDLLVTMSVFSKHICHCIFFTHKQPSTGQQCGEWIIPLPSVYSMTLMVTNGTIHSLRGSVMYHYIHEDTPNSKVHGANMGPIWGQQDPGGPHVGPWLVLSGNRHHDDWRISMDWWSSQLGFIMSSRTMMVPTLQILTTSKVFQWLKPLFTLYNEFVFDD